jgi:hypothetical protein
VLTVYLYECHVSNIRTFIKTTASQSVSHMPFFFLNYADKKHLGIFFVHSIQAYYAARSGRSV